MTKCPPVLICGFNRSDCLRQVFESVRKVRPERLFLALDYPREGRPGDVPGWTACREIFDGVDWPCEVLRNYAEKNMGCKRRMESAITWLFEHVDRGIILEDDCVPHDAFFGFCDELLTRYENDDRVGLIAGHCEHYGMDFSGFDASYYFDRMNTIWGWATWRRAWKHYDGTFGQWHVIRQSEAYRDLIRGLHARRVFDTWVEKVLAGRMSSWALAWWVSCVQHGMFCLHPTGNLVMNVGFSGGGTHAVECDLSNPWSNIAYKVPAWPLAHPNEIAANRATERFVLRHYYVLPYYRYLLGRVSRLMKKIFGR